LILLKKAFGAIALILSLSSIPAAADEKTKTAEMNRLLEAEATLAKAPSSYFIMDFGEKGVFLKVRGIVLKKWELKKVKFWGKPVSIKALKLLKKSAWFPPKRKTIVPGNDEQGNVDLGVLEVKDMPSLYSLTFPGRTRIEVRAKSANFFLFFRKVGSVFRRYTYLPLKTLWLALRKKSFTEIELVVDNEKDSKGLFWAFLEGQSCIIYQPSK
jgi:hypothetical protein